MKNPRSPTKAHTNFIPPAASFGYYGYQGNRSDLDLGMTFPGNPDLGSPNMCEFQQQMLMEKSLNGLCQSRKSWLHQNGKENEMWYSAVV